MFLQVDTRLAKVRTAVEYDRSLSVHCGLVGILASGAAVTSVAVDFFFCVLSVTVLPPPPPGAVQQWTAVAALPRQV